jgi:ribonucleoside-diphosphate reductase alpha chain
MIDKKDSRTTVFTNDFSKEIWETTYKDHNDKTIDDTFKRVAKKISSAETTDKLKDEWYNNFYDMLTDFKVCAGGRILANSGTSWGGTTYINCFVGTKSKYDQDSIDGIMETLTAQVKTLKSEGGWGMNFSFIRPRGSFIYGIGVETPGSVSYMELFNKASEIITSGSGKKSTRKDSKGKIRKGAMMGCLDIWHPDIEEFITSKQKDGRLNKFNISVCVYNDFMDKLLKIKNLQKNNQTVSEDLDKWDLIFPDTKFEKYKDEWDGDIHEWKEKGYPTVVYKTVKITELWKLIIDSTYQRNDPGILFMDRANETHCWNYGGKMAKIRATNPCGEQCLPFSGTCNLSSLNLTQFVDLKNKCFNLDKISKYVKYMVRFLDNVNTITGAPLDDYLVSIKDRRRIGMGVMGWGSSLYMLNIRYASDEAEKLKEELMRTFTHSAVEASIELAKERGMFSGCDKEKHANHMFWKQIGLPKHLIEEIRKYGIRNSSLFSIQPTGNTGIVANNVSGGLEPLFLHEYTRTSICPHVPDEIKNICPKYYEGDYTPNDYFKEIKEGNDVILKYNEYKIDKNRGLTKETICEDYSVRYLKDIGKWDKNSKWAVTTESLKVEEHIKDLFGFSKWIDSSMSKTINIPNDYNYNDFENVYFSAYKAGLKGITTYRAGTMMSVLSSTEKTEKEESVKIQKTKAPKRPIELKGELHHINLKNNRYYVAVGLFEGDVYEVFTGLNHNSEGEIIIPKNVKTGTILKHGRSNYSFINDNKEYHLTNGHNDETADALTRLISTALRHGADVSFVVDQLEKTTGGMLSFSKVLARTLKKYIPDGTIVYGITCPNCNSTQIIRTEGCVTCKSCGHSQCT